MTQIEPRKILFRILGLIVLGLIMVFSYFKYQPMIQGPLLSNISLETWNIVEQSSISVTGSITNTQNIMINGRSLILDESGNFTEIIGLNPGANDIYIDLIDIFGKEKSYYYHVYTEYVFPEFADTYPEALAEKRQAEILLEEESLEKIAS